MIQQDMMMFDHGMPRPDGMLSQEQRPEVHANLEFHPPGFLRERGRIDQVSKASRARAVLIHAS